MKIDITRTDKYEITMINSSVWIFNYVEVKYLDNSLAVCYPVAKDITLEKFLTTKLYKDMVKELKEYNNG